MPNVVQIIKMLNTSLCDVGDELIIINTSSDQGGVPTDPRFVFRAFYYFPLRFFHRYFF